MVQYPQSEQIELRTAIPGSRLISLRRFTCPSKGPVLQGSVSPASTASLSCCTLVTNDANASSRLHFFEPGVKLFSCALTHHLQKRCYQLVGHLSPWACLPEQVKGLQFFLLSRQAWMPFQLSRNCQ